MSLINGLEYINTTKQKLKTRLQGKGVDVVDDTPFREYPDMLESELKNKSWQYPTSWYQLTPKSEFPDHTIEVILYDADYEFSLYWDGAGTINVTMYGGENGGTYTINGVTYNLNQTYQFEYGNTCKIKLTKGAGLKSSSCGFTTFKLVITFGMFLYLFHPRYNDTNHVTYIPILAVRAKETDKSDTHTIYFDSSLSSGIEFLSYGGIVRDMQYCDLSMMTGGLEEIKKMFSDCYNLIKVELPEGFVAPNSCFENCHGLREVEGLDYKNVYNREAVFRYCYKFTPPSLNYVGNDCYDRCNFIGKTVYVTIPDYPKEYFIKSSGSDYSNFDNGEIGSKYKVIIKSVGTFANTSLRSLGSDVILQFPDDEYRAHISTDPKFTNINTVDAFIYNPYKIINGENLYLDKPIGVSINDLYGEEYLNLPHVSLRFFYAYSDTGGGMLKGITFDWENTNFDTCLASNATGYVIDIYGQNFSHDALVELFNNLPAVTISRNIRITNNPGVADLTSSEIAIVTNKGYVLTK